MIEKLQASGLEIRSLTAEEGRLDVLYADSSGGSVRSRGTRVIRSSVLALLLSVMACSGGATPPAEIQRGESCRWCRMSVSDHRFATQLAGLEPRFFDDVGCMVKYLLKEKDDAGDHTAYVSDYRTREWIPAATAVYGRCPSVETPMASHLVAFRDEGSARQDPAWKDCQAVTLSEVFGESLPKEKK